MLLGDAGQGAPGREGRRVSGGRPPRRGGPLRARLGRGQLHRQGAHRALRQRGAEGKKDPL
eukprot:4802948-Pyramimonas_sp.AAC.1